MESSSVFHYRNNSFALVLILWVVSTTGQPKTLWPQSLHLPRCSGAIAFLSGSGLDELVGPCRIVRQGLPRLGELQPLNPGVFIIGEFGAPGAFFRHRTILIPY